MPSRQMQVAVLAIAIAVAGAVLAVNWGWLVAAGIAPVLLAVAPCALMCGLGLCMGGMGRKSCDKSKIDQRTARIAR